MECKISIIIPVYNVEKYIERCLESILNQAFNEYEVIIVNDGSTDNSGKICDKYSEINKNINVIHKKNGGVSSARNLGIDVAKGEYIAFIDPDDFIDSNMFKILYENLKELNGDIAICSVNEIRNDNIELGDNSGEVISYSKDDAIEGYFKGKYPFNQNYLCNKLFKRSLFEKVRLNEDITYQEDSEIMIQLLDLSKLVIYLGRALYNYDLREISLSNGKISKGKITAEKAYECIYKYVCNNLPKYKEEALSKYISLVFNFIIEIIKNYKEYEIEYNFLIKKLKKVYYKTIKSKTIPFKYKIHSTFIILSPTLYKKYIELKLK